MNKTLQKAVELSKLIGNKNLTDVCEFGVHYGATVTQIRKLYPSFVPVFGFDTFTGLPEDWVGTCQPKGSASCGGEIPNVPGVTFYKGLFKDTLLEYMKIAKPMILCHVDCDLYSSTKDVLYTLNHMIQPGTVLCFDEWYYNFEDIEQNRQHEQKCFYEWVEEKNRKYLLLDEIEVERKIVLITE